jgi:hypothetical protein
MRFPFLHQLHRSCRIHLIALMAFMLLGVQVLQHSPLHNHAHEIVDCAMCHVQTLGDDTEHEQSLVVSGIAIAILVVTESIAPTLNCLCSPYQGRAPPPIPA